MIYKPFYDMNILLTDDAISMVANIAGIMIIFHLMFAALLFIAFFSQSKKQSLRLIAEDINNVDIYG